MNYDEILEYCIENGIILNENALSKLKDKFSKKNKNIYKKDSKSQYNYQKYSEDEIKQLNIIKAKLRQVVKKYCDKWSKDETINNKLKKEYNKAGTEDYRDADVTYPDNGNFSSKIFNFSQFNEIKNDYPDSLQYDVASLCQSEFIVYEPVLYEFSNAVIKDLSLSQYNIKSGWADDTSGLWFKIKL